MRGSAIVRAALTGTLAAIILGCGGGGGGSNDVISHLLCSGTSAPAPDQVTLGCPATGIDSITLSVHLGGPTTSSSIYGLKFDLVFDPSVVQFEPPAMEGGFLKKDGASTIMQVGPDPGNPGRLIVAITRQGAVGGLQASSADQTVITLLFRGIATGSTTITFENAAVVDSSLQAIPSISFGTPLTVAFN